MFKLLFVVAVVALGADALYHNGAYTQAAWREISDRVAQLEVVKEDTTHAHKRGG